MSHNEERVERSARNHRPAIIGIAVALAVALIAYLVFMPGTDENNEGIATTPPPPGTVITDAEGLGEDEPAPTISPESGAPVGTEGAAALTPPGDDAPEVIVVDPAADPATAPAD